MSKAQTRVLRHMFLVFMLLAAQYMPEAVAGDDKSTGKP